MSDWGAGHYEDTAAQLEPAAWVVVDRAGPGAGEHVVDVGCGTGNAALLAAERGARVTGIDPAPRLLEVARAAAAARGLDATFALGDAAALPLEDGEADVVLSVFGADLRLRPARRRSGDGARVRARRPDRLQREDPVGGGPTAARAAGEAVRNALGAPAPPPPFRWHESAPRSPSCSPRTASRSPSRRRTSPSAPSPRAYLDEQARHPLAVAGQAVLGPRGEGEALAERMLAIYEAANEDPDVFRVTSHYVVATARRHS